MPSRAEPIRELAILGGTPSFAEPRHVGRPNLGDKARLLERVSGAWDRGWLTNDGPLLKAFEERVRELSGARHCVVVANATLGLEIAVRALGLSGEVIVPSFTFAATAHALSWLGLTPVFCDIDRETHNLDPEAVRAAITPATTGILGVHLWGRAGGADGLAEVARAHGLALAFDAAHAVGCTYGGRPAATLGDAAVISFHATKVANAAEGGAILTDDEALATRMRRMRSFGFVAYDQVEYVGTNAKMSELSAAMGLTSLDAFDSFVAVNRRNYARYAAGLAGLEDVRLIDYADGDQHNYHYVVLEVPPDRRDLLVAALQAENVLARRYFHPGVHRQAPYRDTAPRLPVTDAVAARVLVLPTGTAMSEADIDQVCAVLRTALERADEVRERLTAAS
jgi:dTDP-4-amino-4,6-dideoxygalactose transaminase